MDSGNFALHSKLFELGVSVARLYRVTGTLKAASVLDELSLAAREIEKTYRLIVNRQSSSAGEWICDNRYVALREEKLVRCAVKDHSVFRSCDEGALIFLLSERLVAAVSASVTEDACREFLKGVQTVTVLKRDELLLFHLALRYALLRRLSVICTELSRSSDPDRFVDDLRAVFTAFTAIESIDMSSLCDAVDLTEQTLLRDPTGTYGKMDRKSREYYRERLSMLSESRGMSELDCAAELLKEAMAKSEHIGISLFEGDRAKSPLIYIAANILLTLFMTLLCGFLSHSFIAAILLLLPISELTKVLLDRLLLLIVRPRFLPRMDIEAGIPDEGRSICVLSVLIASADDAREAAKRLEEISLLNRDGSGNLSFGILADLPEAKSPVEDRDASVIAALKAEVAALDAKYGGGFYAFTRPRSCSEDGVFRGFERKRGAVLALAGLLCGRDPELYAAVGEVSELCGTRYIITLDGDTVTAPDSVRELIAAALHPMNKCVLDREKGKVVSGFGIIHPRIGTELCSVYRNDFARIFAGRGGTEVYGGLCGELYMDMFKSGGFYGKGLIDAEALLVCSEAHIPSGRVLSHDAIEGAYLNGGYMSDVEFCDSFPENPIAYYRRLHRWTRGDWQNAAWIFAGDCGLSDIDRFKLFDSLRRSLVMPSVFLAVCLGLIFGARGLSLALWASLLSLAVGLIISISDALCDKSRRMRYHSSVFGGIVEALLRAVIRLWLLPYEAWICLSAAITALWRMLISGKGLLAWETSAQSGGRKNGLGSYFKNMCFCVLSGILLIFAADGIVGITVGLLWLISPLMLRALSVQCDGGGKISADDKAYLLGIAREIWAYFSTFCTETENYLPPDNFQLQPPIGIAHRTSPTNIGLALCSALCAVELGIDRGKGLELIENMLGTLERMPKKHGHLYNWYDTRTLRPLHPKYLSTVDCGNLLACLTVLKNGLYEHRFFVAAKRVEALMAPMELSVFFDPKRQLMRIGIDAESDAPSPAHYDLLASEARLTSYLSVARGDVPKKHWQALSRAMRRYCGYTGMTSWSGTMFEYLMPELFLPLYRNSLIYETDEYCLFVQRHRRSSSGLWGISESAFFSLDPSLSYRYKAHGCSALALKRGQDRELVISPYSAFLALTVSPNAALRNIKRMERAGLRSRFGFIEALDLTPCRALSEGGEPVRSFMAHHLGMSLLAITNLIADKAVIRHMMSEPCIAAYRGLLCEKVPISPIVLELHDKESIADGAHERRSFKRRGEDFDFLHPKCCLLTNGAYSVMSTESGLAYASVGDVLVYASPSIPVGEGHGVEILLHRGEETFSLLPEANVSYLSTLWELGEKDCGYRLETDTLISEMSLAVSGSRCGELRFLELHAKEDLGEVEIELCFEPVLACKNDYVNHPAYWRLGMAASVGYDCLMLHRLPRGDKKELWLCLTSDRKMSFSADRNGGIGALSKPYVSAKHRVRLGAGDRLSLRFCLCVGNSEEEAFEGARSMLCVGPSEYAAMTGAYASSLKMTEEQLMSAMESVLPLHFFMRQSCFVAKEKLWKYGISGDRPIICSPLGMSREDTKGKVKESCFLTSCGMEHDLVLISDEGGDYFRPVYSAVRDTLCAFGLEPLMGEGGSIHIVPKCAEADIMSCASVTANSNVEMTRYTDRLLLPKRHKRYPDTEIEYDHSEDGTFIYYVNRLPPRAWCNMLTNGRFGYIAADNGCGNMWLHNSREMAVSPWKNDPFGEHPDESLEYICGGRRICFFADDDGAMRRICYGLGFARWECSLGDVGLKCTDFVPPSIDARVLLIELCGNIEGQIAWKLPLQMGASAADKNAVSVNYVNRIFEAVSDRSPYPEKFRAAFSSMPLYTCVDLYSWMKQSEDGESLGSYPIFGACLPVSAVTVIACGSCESDVLFELCKPECAFIELESTKKHWQGLLSVFKMKSGDAALDRYMSSWAIYQTLACRLLGRCSIYQSGGATGFRDQLQDAVNLMLFDPSIARRQILTACAHQYLEGDVMHWWHSLPDGDRGVRTRCSDDLLWLVWALCEYVEKTGDCSICDACEYYVNSPPLSAEERDRYEMPPVSDISESVLSHAKRAVDRVLERGVGLHGLLLFGSGDWNDGMDRIEGESVWLSWFFAHTVKRFADLLLMLCKLEPDCYRAAAKRIGTAADSAWDGEWYLRGYWKDGEPLGSASSPQCRIDSVSQSWAAFCGDASNSRVDIALDSALRELYDRKLGTVNILTPPFYMPERDPGYIASYGKGFRENGGQYTHAAVWLAAACLRRGRENEGAAILRDLLPEGHDPLRYEAEPFVLAADVYSALGHEGEAGWTWYTGSSGWYFRTVTEELLGLRLYCGSLYIRPRLPDDFKPCTIRLKGHEIRISREEILLDGEKYDGKGIPY